VLLPRFIARLLSPLVDAVLPAITVEDPWERLDLAVPARTFGSPHDFPWYFEGESQVCAESIDAVCEWLLGCEYVSDPELFNERDFWQHPRTFERLRQGDCEDHALWAWRKLVELGIDAEFVCGECDLEEPGGHGHAWVVFREAGAEFVLEAAAGSRESMIRPLAEVRDQYRPHAAVNARFETTAFSGYILMMKDQRARRRADEARSDR
jgi:hypothetical protein